MQSFDIQGKVIFVTGGTRGLGRAISFHLAAQGAKVIAGYFQKEEAAEQFRDEAKRASYDCQTLKANLMVSSGLQLATDFVREHHGSLDVFIHNAATGVHKPLAELSQRHLATVWQVNVGAFLDLALKFRALMPRGSRIIAISSEGAQKAVVNYGAVGSSKAALESLCRQMAAEWAADGIAVNVVAPGLLETDTLQVWADAAQRVRHETESSPLGRLVRLPEVAHLVHFLCAPASEGIIGQRIVIDGGKCIATLQTTSPSD